MITIGIPIRYDYSKDENKSILYIYDTLRRTIQNAGAEINIILPVQNIDYMETKNSDMPDLTEEDKIRIDNQIKKCDGILFPGGSKFTKLDRYILDYVIKKDIPTLGICLGMQMMSCYNEEVKLEKNETDINHNQDIDYSHEIIINKDSMLYSIIKKEVIMVNSFHNYHALENNTYKTVAKSKDGIIEAIENSNCTYNIGVQWHPEKQYSNDKNSKLLIDSFIKASEKYNKKNNKELVEII